MSLHTTARDATATAQAERQAAFQARETASRHHQLTQQRATVERDREAFEQRIKGKVLGMAEIRARAQYIERLDEIDAEISALES